MEKCHKLVNAPWPTADFVDLSASSRETTDKATKCLMPGPSTVGRYSMMPMPRTDFIPLWIHQRRYRFSLSLLGCIYGNLAAAP
ncbi:hypothetical protein CORC01_12422 [Colletotrichum orchidophilum]|uniref:Uncharacterized protein n=1 Tax=Colletotrichum orchidophilum TaxID=1209926 RepID=A0A1G4AT39_9PEZI|nr:uncharacterized protein CORC01_12422 [Colletotrichum orchidophilum]OHE92253.1 hypothetical protein CORC01_12422 [Colletotrichum orchidophilum]